MSEATHAHSFCAGRDTTRAPLLLLHGSNGTESDLIPVGDDLAPGATKLGIRGSVAMDSGHGFFRRRPDRRVDEADLAVRVPVLADVVRATCHHHRLNRRPLVVGFSNGAVMGAALLMTTPDLLAGAILFRPSSPFTTARDVRLDGTPALVIDGENDTRRSPGDGQHLAEQLRGLGAVVTHRVLPVGHSITGTDRQVARAWIRDHGL